MNGQNIRIGCRTEMVPKRSTPACEEGEPIVIEDKDWIDIVCCDCGLTHTYVFQTCQVDKKKAVRLIPFRDERKTGQFRRWMKKYGEGVFGNGGHS